ncbi:sodium- and chloride-dependent neutral and basic amino acid transporter B(0+)-like [Pleurodeles waltl]|uniref:sodium- and chloride-dependent neutral and basic amino acid transporter B(0+)-like n=1 Tax=Pleurodeles waltl TaxID=8319 RepID=UPI003709581D
MDLTKIVPWVFLKCCKKPESSDPDSQAEQEDDKTDRATWSNKTEYLLSMVGYAVGLGNIWRFPYLTYKNGGGAFLIPYLIMMIFTGLPLYLLESALGQFASLGPVLVWRSVPFFQGVGITMVIVSTLVCIYYNVIVAYALYYLFASFTKVLPWSHCFEGAEGVCSTHQTGICNVTSGSNSTDAMNLTWVEANNETCINNRTALDNVTLLSKEYWDKVVLHRSSGLDETGVILWPLALCLLLAWIMVAAALFKGIKSSGKVIYFTCTWFFLQLNRLLIEVETLTGSWEGLNWPRSWASTMRKEGMELVAQLRQQLVELAILAIRAMGGTILSELQNFVSVFVAFYQALYTSEVAAHPAHQGPAQVISKLPYHEFPEKDGFLMELYKWAGNKGPWGGHQTKLEKYAVPQEKSPAADTWTTLAQTMSGTPGDKAITLKDIMSALQGIRSSLKTKIDRVNSKLTLVWKDAATQIFYSYSIAWGGLMTLSSYNKFSNDCLFDTLFVCIVNSVTTIFAGFAIFSILGHMAHELNRPVSEVVDSGFSLAFIAYPEALTTLPVSPLWSILFFLMLLTLGFDTQFSTLETLTTAIQDAIPDLMKRFRVLITIGCCTVLFLLGLPCVTQAGIYWVNLIDYFCGGWTLIVAAVVEQIGLCWVYGVNRFVEDLEMMPGKKHWIFWLYWRACWFVISPLLVTAILIWSLVTIELPSYGSIVYPTWGLNLGWCLTAFTIIWIPVVAIYKVWAADGTLFQRLKSVLKPAPNWGPALQKDRGERYKDMVDDKQSDAIETPTAAEKQNGIDNMAYF